MDATLPHYIRGRDGVKVLKLSLDDVRALDVSRDGRNLDLIVRFLHAWQAVLADGPKQCGKKPLRVFDSFEKFCLSQPLLQTITTYANLGDQILESSRQGRLTGDFIREMLSTPVAKEYIHWHRTGDSEVLTYLMSFLWFGKKLRIDDPSLHETAFRGWLAVEDRLRTIALPEKTMADLKTIISVILHPPDLRDLYPGHGPGSVSEKSGRSRQWKNRNLRFDPKLDRAFIRGGMRHVVEGYDVFMESKPVPFPKGIYLVPELQKWTSGIYRHTQRSSKVSKLLFVPKTVKTARSICKEPVSYMYFQQLVRAAFERAFKTSILGRFVRLEDQSRNQRLSGLGSEYGHLDTIDLAAASDSVSWTLVQNIFPRQWLYYLSATRTSSVKLPDGAVFEVSKFAPMGSACCFPVQSVIFCAVTLLAYVKHARGSADADAPVTKRELLRVLARIDQDGSKSVYETEYFAPVAVYGDDIICDSNVTSDVITTLGTLGFRVNESKSFRGNQCVRESCGSYWWNGADITPTLFRVKPSKKQGLLDPQSLASIIANANNAGKAGLKSLQLLLIRWALFDRVDSDIVQRDRGSSGIRAKAWGPSYKGPNPILFTSDPEESLALVVERPENSHLPIFYDVDLHQFVFRRWILSDDVETDVGDGGDASLTSGKTGKQVLQRFSYPNEHYAYMQWWSKMSSIDTTRDNIPRRVDRTSVDRTLLSWGSHVAMRA